MRVYQDSINSIIIDEAPNDKYLRMLVAGSVSLNSLGDILVLKHTSLMPNIIGLPALATLLFTPSMELRWVWILLTHFHINVKLAYKYYSHYICIGVTLNDIDSPVPYVVLAGMQ